MAASPCEWSDCRPASDQHLRLQSGHWHREFFSLSKLLLLAIFIVIELMMPVGWARMAPDHFVPPFGIISGAMLIFLNYVGFELIANASEEVAELLRTLSVAYFGGVLIVIAIYVLTVMVMVGHLDFQAVQRASDSAMSVAAEGFMGRAGFLAIAIAALMAMSSAIYAAFYSTGKLV